MAASHPKVCSAPCLVAHGTWKYATANPPRVRARLMSALISPYYLEVSIDIENIFGRVDKSRGNSHT